MQPFNEEQKQYLQGFMAGVMQRGGLPFAGETPDGSITHNPAEASKDLAEPGIETLFGTPVDELCKQEQIKLAKNPHAMWDEVLANAAAGKMPEGDDIFRYKALGLFNVAPVQEGFMLRCRIPGGRLTASQLHGMADLATKFGGGYSDITTRGNIQLREIDARHAGNLLEGLYDIGMTSKGAGADNLRNITATSTAGFDPQELYDVMPLARSMQHYILNSEDLYGLPRKFNIAFDGAGQVSTASDTNDLCFRAVAFEGDDHVAAGVYFRVELGGITGHGDFARDTGFMVAPDQCIAVAAAVVRVYLENGNRTNRKKARLKYLLQDWGVDMFMDKVQGRLAFPLIAMPRKACAPDAGVVRHRHVGFHAQKQAGLYYAGVVVPVGRLQSSQMTGLADIAHRYGAGEVRLTIFQNLLIPGIREADIPATKDAILNLGLHVETEDVRSGLVACTGAEGCPYANTKTKTYAIEIGNYLAERVMLDQPINIHYTGCPNSCAQHYCGDIGLLGVQVKQEDGTKVDGCTIVLGGGMDQDQGIARELVRSVPFSEVPPMLAGVLDAYLEKRVDNESFAAFTRRHDDEALQSLFLATNDIS